MARRIGIKAKVWCGCIVMGAVLICSGFISMFEYSKMNDYVSNVISDNISGINAARELLSVAEQYNVTLMNDLVIKNATDSIGKYPVVDNEKLISVFDGLRKRFTTPEERAAADSVLYAYAAYMQVVLETEEIWREDYKVRQQWFFSRLQPVYLEFRAYMLNLTQVCQDVLVKNSATLQEGFYRSLMPGLISVGFGFVMVLLLNYYLNYLVINPVLRITKGVKAFRQFGRPFNVKVDSDDEISDLCSSVEDIVDLNQSYRKQLKR